MNALLLKYAEGEAARRIGMRVEDSSEGSIERTFERYVSHFTRNSCYNEWVKSIRDSTSIELNTVPDVTERCSFSGKPFPISFRVESSAGKKSTWYAQTQMARTNIVLIALVHWKRYMNSLVDEVLRCGVPLPAGVGEVDEWMNRFRADSTLLYGIGEMVGFVSYCDAEIGSSFDASQLGKVE